MTVKTSLAALGLLSLFLLADCASAATKTQGDFNLSNRFSMEIDGVLVAGVHTIEGLTSESEVVEYKDGEDGVSHTRPGNHKPGKLTLTRNWSRVSDWPQWRDGVAAGIAGGAVAGKLVRRSISVIFHNDAGEEAGRMNFYNCWPSAYVVNGVRTKEPTPVTESVELRFDRVEL